MEEIILPQDLWSIIIKIEEHLQLPANQDEYQRVKTLLNIVLQKVITQDLIYENMVSDLQTTIKFLDMSSKENMRLIHFVRDQLNYMLIHDLSLKLRKYQQKFEESNKEPFEITIF